MTYLRPYFDDVAPLGPAPHGLAADPAERILAVGAPRDFPPCYARLVESEIPGAEWSFSGDVAATVAALDPGGAQTWPSLLLIGAGMVHRLDATLAAARAAPCPPAVAIAYRDADMVSDAFAVHGVADGVVSFLPMRSDVERWIGALRLILSGNQYLPPELVRARLSTSSTGAGQKGRDPLDALTERERMVLELVADGRQNKQIAADLGLSEHTVKMHVHRACRKLGVRNRTQAALLARER
jgi:DNA-binding NarL/FixJ family response regulator